MTQDKIKEVKAIYFARNKNNTNLTSKPFFAGIIEKLDKTPKRNRIKR